MISVYRGKSSIFEYLAAGSVTGALYKFNMGLRGMTAGGLVGLAFGGVAGGLSLAIMKATGTSMEEVRYWQYKWKTDRDALINEVKRAQPAEPDHLMDQHDAHIGAEKLSLDFVDVAAKAAVKK
jgi:complex I assembly factor TIMMDC1